MAFLLYSIAVLGIIASDRHLFATGTGLEAGAIQPSPDCARENGRHIFNAVHSAMRQWGSSLNHNGMSFFPATIPQGVLLYHGTYEADAVTGMEWLAFEIEHAEFFARPMPEPPGRPNHPPKPAPPYAPGQSVLTQQGPPRNPGRPFRDGYLHVYRITRPQRLLYVDGMSGAKSELGTLDTQDILLRNRTSNGTMEDYARARALCEMAGEWHIDGIIRMEAGFELIKCNFDDGMELISANKRPWREEREDDGLNQMEYMRAVAQRYWDIAATRVSVDFTSMISAFFYPTNLTNPDSRFAKLPRMVSMDWKELEEIKREVGEALSTSQWEVPQLAENWQGVTDLIVSRYSERLRFIAERATLKELHSDLNGLLDIFIDYGSSPLDLTAATQECTQHFLRPVSSVTGQDELIRAALESVSHRVCTDLFTVRGVVSTPGEDQDTLIKARTIVRDLMEWLDWAEWRKCSPCEIDQVCFVAIWPFGNAEDHYSPSCLNKTQLQGRYGYWHPTALA